MKFLGLLFLIHGHYCNAVLFARRISLMEPELTFVLQQTGLARTIPNVVECAAYVTELTSNPIKALRPSLFTYVKSNSSCTPGRTPTFEIFNSNTILDHGDVDIYEIVGKPLATNNLDTWFYAVLNEELSAYWGHPNFINAWPSGQVPDWYTNIAYNVPSPVISHGGQYAMTFTSPAGLWYTTPKIASMKYCTFLAWYKPVEDIAGSYGIVTLYSPDLMAWISLNMNNGYVTAGLYNSPNIVYTQSNTQTVTNGGPWVYVGFTMDCVAGNITIWINGVYSGTALGTYADIGPRINTLRIAGNGGQNAIASVEIYMKALNQAQVQAAMAKSTTGRTTTAQLPN